MHAPHDVSTRATWAMSVDWAATYESHAGELTGYLAKLSGDAETASELMQETFIRGLRGGSSIREPAAVRAWLYRTATNLAHNHRRRRALLRFIPFTGAEHASARDSFDPEADQVRRALRSIGTDTAATLLLFYVNGFSRAEIAGMLEVSEETVKSRLARGRRDFMAAYARLERGLAR
jgi:RNA polymerase sigma-70 factor (ECF subfamily)